jgi:hypothetical protein
VKDRKRDMTAEAIIDVYSIKNGDYTFSFKVPNYKGWRAQNMIPANGGIYFVFAGNIIRFYKTKFLVNTI